MLLKIRTVIFVLVISISMSIYWPIPCLSKYILSEKSAYYITTGWGRFVLKLIKYILGITYQVQGAHNIPEKPCIVLSKHQSALDIFVLLTVFDPQSWVFKKELFRIPFFGWALTAAQPIAIDRRSGRQALKFMIESGREKLKKGYWVVLYPEGTRTKPGEQSTYKSGGVLLAQKAQTDIVPVALNTGLFWQKGKGAINSGVVDIVIGEPISTADKDVKAITKDVETWIEKNALEITLNHPYYLKLKQTT